MRIHPSFALLLLSAISPALADGPADNIPAKVRPIPPKGKPVPEVERKSLTEEMAQLAGKIAAIEARHDPKIARYLPDVRIHHKAVRYALDYDEFFDPKEIAAAHVMLKEGSDRADALLSAGKAPWMDQTGLVWLAYTSKIDGSDQPYALIVPDSWQRRSPFRHRLDIWFHGRGETRTEVFFYAERHREPSEFLPEDAFVLHPYGRFCNAAKFAGEVDAFEALDDVKSRYKIDEDRISVRGFSMGGASAWHFAVHYPDKWFAANPGAGFAETPRFLNVFQNEKVEPTWYEKKLCQMYDCTDWAMNLAKCPTIAYSGELDPQKQAADVMAAALMEFRVPLAHVVGPKTKHQYEKNSHKIVEEKMVSLAKMGRTATSETNDTFVSYTLRYNVGSWIQIDALDTHWERAMLDAAFTVDDRRNILEVGVKNVAAFSVHIPAGFAPIKTGSTCFLHIMAGEFSQEFEIPSPPSDRSYEVSAHFKEGRWNLGPVATDGLRKKHGLQGPIDDAFLDAFTIVRPTGSSKNEKVSAWVKAESDRAVRRWRTQMRGDAKVKDDTAVTDADIASSNLVLWGDHESNAVLKKIADKLPIQWKGDQLVVGDKTYAAADHVPILIFPNPLNPEKYVVLNSGFTYREYDDLNNARQVPKLPDWAVVDVNRPPDARFPGKVVDANFFDEAWKLKKEE